MTITAQHLYNYARCAHRVYLDAHGDPGERSEVGPFVQLLWESGQQAERDYLCRFGPDDYSDLQALAIDEALPRTEQLMRGGAPLIYQGAIQSGDCLGRPDLLMRMDESASDWGPFYYEAVDIKAGHGWEERGSARRFKEHYAFQILFYREILRGMQGYLPDRGRIVNIDGDYEDFDPREFHDRFRAALHAVRRLVEGTCKSEPVLGGLCHMCHWYQRCRRWVEGTHDPSGLFYVGKLKFKLKQAGLRTVEDIARMDIDAYTTGRKKIPGAGRSSLERMQRRAAVRLSGLQEIRFGYRLPESRREIFFDIEDDPTRDVTYLFGWVERRGREDLGYQYVLAHEPADEGSAVAEFWQFIAAARDAVFYVYSAKERSTLRKLMQRYELDRAVYEKFVASEYDLYTKLVVPYSDWPTYSYGVKQIARLIGFKWRDRDPGGANSIAWYNEYLAHPNRDVLLQRILDYNEDDCRAMMVILDYFAAQPQASG